MAKPTDDKSTPRIVNRKARHDYFILDSFEVGIVLQGSEVKSIRNGQVSLAEGFAMVNPTTHALELFDVDIAPYAKAHGPAGHEPKRVRRLLAHKREIIRIGDQVTAKGTTLVPLTMYFVRGKVKVELGIGQGKKQHDKRQSIKNREADREMQRGMTRKKL